MIVDVHEKPRGSIRKITLNQGCDLSGYPVDVDIETRPARVVHAGGMQERQRNDGHDSDSHIWTSQESSASRGSGSRPNPMAVAVRK